MEIYLVFFGGKGDWEVALAFENHDDARRHVAQRLNLALEGVATSLAAKPRTYRIRKVALIRH